MMSRGCYAENGPVSVCVQETARRRKGWSLDAVRLGSDVLRSYKDDIKTAPLEGVYVHGLVIDNAAWDTRTSRITYPKQLLRVRTRIWL